MGQSRPRSTSSKWSSVPCLAGPNFLCYGNACSMRPDLDRAPWVNMLPLLYVSRVSPRSHLSPTQARADAPLFLPFVASRLTYFGEGPFIILTVNTHL